MCDTYQHDQEAQELLTRLDVRSDNEEVFSLQNGLIRYKQRFWLPSGSPMTVKIIEAFHASPLGVHSGVPVTLRKLKKLFYWKGMTNQVHKMVQECLICQRAKPDRAKYPGLLAPLPVPSQYWQLLAMDFVEGLPKSGCFNCILVVVDKLSKYAHFIGLQHPFIVSTVTTAFMDNIYKLHGMPESIVIDSDCIFTSRFWREIAALTSTKLKMSSSHHP